MPKVTELFNELYESICAAQKAVEADYLKQIHETYFEDGKPKTTKLELNGKSVEIPLFTLVPHHALRIDECSVALEVEIERDKKQGLLAKLGRLRRKRMAKVKIKFKGCDKAEGLARVGDSLVNQTNY